MSTVYGPVPSWRFGRSLGIDVITPPKKCTFNCIYCQLGRTTTPVIGPEGFKHPPITVSKVLEDLETLLKRIDLNTVDIVTFSGTGEPTLNLELGDIAKAVKHRMGDVPLAILTNSSLLHRDNIRKTLRPFDLVVTKLDAGDDETFRLINRPVNDRLDVATVIAAIKRTKNEVKGTLALEVMLLSSQEGYITNVEGEPLRRLLDAILDIGSTLVQLEVPYRPPAESRVRSPSLERITLISQSLARRQEDMKLWVYGLHDKRGKQVLWLEHESLEREVMNLLRRRPCRDVDVSASLGLDLATARSLLRNLETTNRLISKVSNEEVYYTYR